jgi:peptide chain release factor 1
MNERARTALKRYRELDELLARPEIASNVEKLRELGKERADIEELARAAEEYESCERSIEEARQILEGPDEELGELADAELVELEPRLTELEAKLTVLSIPKDPDDSRNAIVEVRAGTGGDEAALFAGDIYRMYLRFADRHGWKTETMTANETEIGGVKEVVVSL